MPAIRRLTAEPLADCITITSPSRAPVNSAVTSFMTTASDASTADTSAPITCPIEPRGSAE